MPGITTAFAQGLATNRPAASASNNGYCWLSTDVAGGTLYQSNGSSWVQLAAPVNTAGTVTSVGLSVPAELAVSGSPVTTGGTLAVTKATQSANLVWAGPASGSAAAPTFRALAQADVPPPVAAGSLLAAFQACR